MATAQIYYKFLVFAIVFNNLSLCLSSFLKKFSCAGVWGKNGLWAKDLFNFSTLFANKIVFSSAAASKNRRII